MSRCRELHPTHGVRCCLADGHDGEHETRWTDGGTTYRAGELQGVEELGWLLKDALAEYFAQPGFLEQTVTRVRLVGVRGPGRLQLELEFTVELKPEAT